jgi:ABC-type Fe3+ transport system permease subunit
MMSERTVKAPFRAPKIHREWWTTLLLSTIAALLSVAVAIKVAADYF